MILPVIEFAEGYENILRVGVANDASNLGPGRDHSNVGFQYYVNAFNTLIGKNSHKAEIEFEPGLATS